LYDGVFGEGSLRASANQARALTWTPGLGLDFWSSSSGCLSRVCTITIANNARNLSLHLTVACALVQRHLYHSSLFHVCDTDLHLSLSGNSFNASRSVSKDSLTNPTASP
jgi:hypothetical protein